VALIVSTGLASNLISAHISQVHSIMNRSPRPQPAQAQALAAAGVKGTSPVSRSIVTNAAAGAELEKAAERNDMHEQLHNYLLSTPLHELMQQAAHKRDEAFGKVITFSPKVTQSIPLQKHI
jgi:hypothetical protein